MEYIHGIIFYIISIAIIISGIFVIFSKRIMNAVFSSLICFICFGLLFFALNSPFNGVVQFSIYGIALTILFAISIMLTDYKNEENHKIKLSPKLFLILFGALMIISSTIIFIKETINYEPSLYTYIHSSSLLTSFDNLKQLSVELLTNNIYAFELLGVYLLIVLIGISVLLAFKGESK